MTKQFTTLNITSEDEAILRRIQDLMTQVDAEFTKLSEETKEKTLNFHGEDTTLNHCIRWGLQAVEDLIEDIELPVATPIFGYYINLDERGDFSADVRDFNGETIFEIKAGDNLGEDESSIFEDGFMRDKTDISGLTTHLRDINIIPKDGNVLSMTDFESEQEARA